MNSRILLCALLFSVFSGLLLASEGQPGAHRSESPDGAAVGFANLSDGDVLPPRFLVEFSITGMGIAPAGAEIDNTGHHHLLIDVVELPDLNQPLPASDNIRDFGKGQSQTELQLTEGQHSLQMLLADHAHIPHNPPIMSDVIVIVVSVDAPPPD